jgi:hypothetical protein
MFEGGFMMIETYTALTAAGVPEDRAKAAVKELDDAMGRKLDFGINAVRGDIAGLQAKVTTFQAETKAEITKTNAEIAKVEDRLGAQIAKTNAEIIKVEGGITSIRWFIGALAASVAVFVPFANHLLK